ncbi:MAG: family 20 glycosylhydrolase [Lentisphaeria bacterium]|nr:family 20 glycosylhydrolase [Lentisphaeria bacterium]
MREERTKFLHLDLKGISPQVPRFREYLAYFASLGFDGIVLECDCRIPWKCWEGAGEILYTREEITLLAEYAESLDMEVIPLIQVQGHMEWVLKQEKYAFLREDGFFNDLCPSRPESAEKLFSWIDDAAELFPRAKRIHLGGDEAWHLGKCPLCRERIASDPLRRGKLGLFADHVSSLARYAKEKKGLQVLLWDDMFCRTDKALLNPLLDLFPADTIFVHWNYHLKDEEAPLVSSMEKRTVWGASALRCGFANHFVHVLNPVGERIRNIRNWEKAPCPVLHTTWGRPNNLWNPYGPWEALIPEFYAAGRGTAAWEQHPWNSFVKVLDGAMEHGGEYKKLEHCLALAKELPVSGKWEEQGRNFFLLGIRYELLRLEAKSHLEVLRARSVLGKYGRRDPAGCEKEYAAGREKFREKVSAWEKDLETFWKENLLSDFEEYRDLRKAEFFPELLFGEKEKKES